MTRVKIAAGILVTLVVLCVVSVCAVRRTCRSVMTVLEQAEAASARKEMDEVRQLCGAAYERWDSVQWILMCTVSHEKLTTADESFCRLVPLLEAECDEFDAELTMVQAMLLHIVQGETPYLSNVF